MAVRLDKAWVPLTEENLKSIKGQLGVYQLGSEDEGVTYIGCADARTLFGLKGELEALLGKGIQTSFRIEITSAYQTRFRELLMVFYADHQRYPRYNDEADLPRLGRLSPA